MKEFAKAGAAQWAPEFSDVKASGDLAAAFSKWQLTAEAADGSTKVLAINNSVDFFHRNGACQRKITRSLNYPLK